MSRLRKREHCPEGGAASTVVAIARTDNRFRLKVEIRMAAPFMRRAGDEDVNGCFCLERKSNLRENAGQGRVEKGYAMKLFVMICLIFVVTIIVPGCNKETEEDKVRKVITDIQKAAEEKDVKTIINNLDNTYNDVQGFNRETIKRLLLGYFLQHPKISVYINNLQISIEKTSAKALFQTILTSGNKTGSPTDVLPKSLGMYRFDVSLSKESDGWKVTSARWERVENE